MAGNGVKNRLSHHIAWFGDSKLRQDGWGNVGQRGRLCRDVPVAQEYARDEGVIHAVVAAPRIRVVLENVWRKGAEDRLPSRTIAAVVADENIRSGMGVRAAVDLRSHVHPGHDW